MIRLIELTPNKTYASRDNAIKAVEKKFGPRLTEQNNGENIVYFIHTHTDGRFFPVFVGMAAISAGIHFHFNVVAS